MAPALWRHRQTANWVSSSLTPQNNDEHKPSISPPLQGFVPSYTRKYLTMPSLLITVFVIQLVIHLISTIGASTLNDLVFPYTRTQDLHRADTKR
jgi:hypothetical protein